MGRLRPFICLFLLAVMPAAAAQAGAPDFPFHFQSFLPSLLFLFLLSVKEAHAYTCWGKSWAKCNEERCIWEQAKCQERFAQTTTTVTTTVEPTPSRRPPSLLTRDIKILGEDCSIAEWGNNDVWTYQGNTADGRPYYHNVGIFSFTGKEIRDYYLYYDANCDGTTGTHSKKGHPQWVMSENKPSMKRLYDLEGDNKCVGNIRKAALYSIEETFDWTFTFGKVNSNCPHLVGKSNWDTAYSYGGLVGCPEPQPSYTLEWSKWESTEGKECSGTEVRTHPRQRL